MDCVNKSNAASKCQELHGCIPYPPDKLWTKFPLNSLLGCNKKYLPIQFYLICRFFLEETDSRLNVKNKNKKFVGTN